MILIVGLGNPGQQYSETRHNAGFIAVDYLSGRYNFLWQRKTAFKGEIATGSIKTDRVVFLKPATYMNLSGQAVSAVCAYHKIKAENIFVIHDDIDLNIGRVKLKYGGGSGGHNGLKSIDQYMGNNYYRIRIGVDRPEISTEISDYVLEKFSTIELKKIDNVLELIDNSFALLLAGKPEEFRNGIR